MQGRGLALGVGEEGVPVLGKIELDPDLAGREDAHAGEQAGELPVLCSLFDARSSSVIMMRT